MEELDLKNIWKSAYKKESETKHYSLNDIQLYRQKRSKTTSKSIRRSIFFDIGYKSVIVLELIYLLFTLNYQFPYQLVIALLLILSCSLIFLETRFITKLNQIKETESIIITLKEKLIYLKTTFKKFIYTSALSNSLFFISGMFLYDHFKYGKIQSRNPLDDLILYLILALSYLIPLIGQFSFYKIQLQELNENIEDIDDTYSSSIKIEESKKRRIKYIIISSILVLIGIIILIILINR